MAENKGDLISREALKKLGYINKGNFNTVEGIREWIDNAPTVEAIPTELHEKILDQTIGELLECQSHLRPQGEWLKSDIPESVLAKCSICGFNCGAYTYNFCPNCGACMEIMKNDD